MDSRRFAAALAGALFCMAAVSADGAQAQGSPTRGRQIVERNCAMCHATGIRGESPSKTAPRFRDLSNRYPIEMLEEALAEGMLTRHPAMPEFRFKVPEIDDIISYLVSIQVRQPVGLRRTPEPSGAPIRTGGR